MILSLDPGLSCTGWVLVRPPTRPSDTELRHALLAWGSFSTDTADPLPSRLASIQTEIRHILSAHREVTDVLVEAPARAGAYDRSTRGAKVLNAVSMSGFWQARGALLAALPDEDVAIHEPVVGTRRKQTVTEVVRFVWPQLCQTRNSNAHIRDAAHLALAFLRDNRRKVAA